jgi:A/G-specific adenine glycosylase
MDGAYVAMSTDSTSSGGNMPSNARQSSNGGSAPLARSRSFDADAFRERILMLAAPHWRDLPWRRTRDPYLIWLSEVMLQQTQVVRVEARWADWIARFPSVQALAAASDAEVLAAWQGMGYNRRALSLHRAASAVVERYAGVFPHALDELLSLPGVGPSTAAGIRAFAFNEPGVYLETNVRAVFIHELFADDAIVSDKELEPLVRAACPAGDGADVRGWYYALLDYGAFLKHAFPNPTRRAKAYSRQSRFEGSHRQKRAQVLRIVLDAGPAGVTSSQVADALDAFETAAGRDAVGLAGAEEILAELKSEGFCMKLGDSWRAGADHA